MKQFLLHREHSACPL